MPRLKLTVRAVERLRAPDPSGRQTLHWDTELRGFGVLASGTTNGKSYIVQRDLPGGRTRRVTVGPTNVLTLDEARRRAGLVLADIYRGIDPKTATRGAMTLREALVAYLSARPKLSPRSVEDYRRAVEVYLSTWAARPLREITRELVEARHRNIAGEVAAARGVSGAATANGAMVVLRALWNFSAERDSTLGANPVQLRRQWFPVPRREGHVSFDQLPVFYSAVRTLQNPVAADYLRLLLFTGLRRREAAGLRWNDIDFAARMVRLPARATKAGRRLDLPMSTHLHALLVTRRALGDADWVFPANSRSGHIEEPKGFLDQVAASTGIRISVHDLRRTFITVAESTDISSLALKALVNHSIGTGVTEGYIQMSSERLREAAQRVADRLAAHCRVHTPAAENIIPLAG